MAIFFLRKSSKEVREKTRHSSCLRTFIYLFLTIIFSIIYYRTFQVATIINRVYISSLRGAEDSLQHSTDTIYYLTIYNNFRTLDSYKNPFFDIAKNDEKYTTDGALNIVFGTLDTLKRTINDRSCFTAEIKNEIDSLSGQKWRSYRGPIYDCYFFATSIPNLISFYPAIRYDKPIIEEDSLCLKIENVGNVMNSREGKIMIVKQDINNNFFPEALAYQKTIIAKDTVPQLASFKILHPLLNTIDIFTAADLSQYTYCLELNSDMYIKNINVAYNVPVEINESLEGIDIYSASFCIYDEGFINDQQGNRPYMFHVKLPTMANLQQIRSLILTAIVTALFSLFCTNLFYVLRKKALIYIVKKQRKNISNNIMVKTSEVKNIKLFFYMISFIIILLVFIHVSMGALGYTFLIESEKDGWYLVIKGIWWFILISVCVYFMCFNSDISTKRTRIKGRIKIFIRQLKLLYKKKQRKNNVISGNNKINKKKQI